MKEKNINIILGVLVLVFIGALFFYGYDYYNAKTKINETEFYLSDGSICKDVISYNEFKFCNQSTNLVNLYLLEINGTVQLKSPEFKKGKLLHINELEKICSSQNYEIENWSKIALEPLKKYLE